MVYYITWAWSKGIKGMNDKHVSKIGAHLNNGLDENPLLKDGKGTCYSRIWFEVTIYL